MAKKLPGNDADGEVFDNAGKQIFDTTLKNEVEKSFLEYSYSVITSRALPDARDGLKPVHRRILFSMHEAGLTPSHAFVKSARVVGATMSSLHPHGDSAIYEAMVRLSQDFSLNTPLVEGHGNFGSPNDGPAASRYCVTGDTRVRLADGSTIAISDIVPNSTLDSDNDISLMVLDKAGKPVHASKFFNSGIHPIKSVKVAGGASIRGSHNHLVLTLQTAMGVPVLQWMQLDELCEGMFVVLTEGEVTETPFISEYILEVAREGSLSNITNINFGDGDDWLQNRDFILSEVLEEEDAAVVSYIMDAGYRFQPVIGVSDEKPEAVYSLRVDSEDHSFLAGGFVNHNTEARMSKNAMLLVEGLDENTVDMVPNYDGSEQEPSVLPAAFPNLLVNGSAGIAVGMATNMIPHNLNEAVSAVRFLIKKPNASLSELMDIIPGPDLPTGGVLIGLDEVEKAYADGKGSVRIRAKGEVEPLDGSRGRMSIVFTELPYGVGSERIIEKIKDEIGKKRLQGISDVKDLSDRRHGTRLVVELKTGVNPNALLSELYKFTPLETSFGISNLALVDGAPQTLGLKELLEVFLAHRYEVVTRRTQFRLDKAEARNHIIEGLLKALTNIDEVVKVIKASSDTANARTNLMAKFILTDIQAGHILEMPLRRLVSLEVESLQKEKKELDAKIAEYKEILGNRKSLEKLVDNELAEVNKNFVTPRKTLLVGGELKEIIAAEQSQTIAPEIPDTACEVFLTAFGLIGKVLSSYESEAKNKKSRQKHDLLTHIIGTSARSNIVLISNLGKAYRVPVLGIPDVGAQKGYLSPKGAMQVKELASLAKGERIVGIAPATHETAEGIAMGTKQGTIKIVNFDFPTRSEEFDVMGLKDGDEIIYAGLVFKDDEFVFISSDTSLLHFPASSVRAQGRTGGGVAGFKLGADAEVIAFSVVPKTASDPMVVTSTGQSVKVTPLSVYPGKGRATGGVRSHKLLKGEESLTRAGVFPNPAAADSRFDSVGLPSIDQRRDGSGVKIEGEIESIGFTVIIE